jgi:hypothetical protein
MNASLRLSPRAAGSTSAISPFGRCGSDLCRFAFVSPLRPKNWFFVFVIGKLGPFFADKMENKEKLARERTSAHLQVYNFM